MMAGHVEMVEPGGDVIGALDPPYYDLAMMGTSSTAEHNTTPAAVR